jgi:hypothetical protein
MTKEIEELQKENKKLKHVISHIGNHIDCVNYCLLRFYEETEDEEDFEDAIFFLELTLKCCKAFGEKTGDYDNINY